MISAIDFVDLTTFSALAGASNLAAISIGNPGEHPPGNLSQFDWHTRAEFLDIETPPVFGMELGVESIADFLMDLHSRADSYKLVVHCFGGVSRSAAVALMAGALAPEAYFPRKADAFYANSLVLELAQKELKCLIPVPESSPSSEGVHEFCPPRLLI